MLRTTWTKRLIAVIIFLSAKSVTALLTPFQTRTQFYSAYSAHSWFIYSQLLSTAGPPERVKTILSNCVEDAACAESSLADINQPEFLDPLSGREVWLDLRGTAISPREACKFLGELLSEADDGIHITDFMKRVLVDEVDFFQRSDAHDVDDVSSILYASSTERDLIAASDEIKKQSTAFGTILTIQTNQNLDPMLALEIVLEQGRWVLLEADWNDSVDWICEQVASLYAFLLSYDFSVEPGSLIVPTLPRESRLTGGVAISIPTKAALMKLESTLTTTAFSRQMKSSNKSSVLLPTGVTDSKLQTALILPFDADLWRLLIDLKQVGQRDR
jgi:hypothetical protein